MTIAAPVGANTWMRNGLGPDGGFFLWLRVRDTAERMLGHPEEALRGLSELEEVKVPNIRAQPHSRLLRRAHPRTHVMFEANVYAVPNDFLSRCLLPCCQDVTGNNLEEMGGGNTTEPSARSWWTVGGSNPRPPHCERGALPAELTAHTYRRGGIIHDGRRGVNRIAGCLARLVGHCSRGS